MGDDDAYLESTVKGVEGVYGLRGQVNVVPLRAGDSDVGDGLLGLSRWSARESGDFIQAKGPRWVRGWVSTDVVLHRLMACEGRWEEGCPWDTPAGTGTGAGAGNATTLPTCDYFLFTNTDNAYGAAFLSEVWEKGIAPLWQGSREGFWGGVRRTGRDLVGVNYITYYKSGGASGLGEESSRYGPRIVAFPPHPSSEGQSLDLGALVWSGRALVESKGGGGFLVRELRERVLGGLVGAAQQQANTPSDDAGATADGGGGGGGVAGAAGAGALSAAAAALPLLCTTGLTLFCDPHWATLGGQRSVALNVEEALKGVWPTVYARDHVQAHEVHSTVILPKRLEVFARGRKDESTRFAEALVAAARGEGVMGVGKVTTPDLDPVIVLPGMLFFHQ